MRNTASRTRSSPRWARWACSACRSPRSTAAWAATTSRWRWRSRSSARSTSPWRSRWRPAVGLGAMPIYRFGTEEQKQKWLPDLTAGRALAGFGLTEPGAGSDAGGTRTTARLEGDEWIINGNKQFITNSGTDITSLVTVTAVTGSRRGRQEGDLDDHRAQRHTGIHRRAGLQQGRLERVGHPPADLRRRPRARRRTCWAPAAAATRTSCPSWTRAASRSPRWRPGRRRAASTRASSTPRSVSRSASRSAPIRRSASRSRGWKRAPTSRARRTTRRPQRCWRASRSRRRRRSRR